MKKSLCDEENSYHCIELSF